MQKRENPAPQLTHGPAHTVEKQENHVLLSILPQVQGQETTVNAKM
jgi:hypothetical protein